MASNRCFDSFNANVSAGDYSIEKRNTTIYNEINKNVTQLLTANPVKSNGFTYNRTTTVNPTCSMTTGYLNTAISYEIKSSVVQGAELVNPPHVVTPKYESWCGNLYSVTYSSHGVNDVVQADASFINVVVDPSYLIFYDECDLNFLNINKPEEWINLVDFNSASTSNTYFALQANNDLCDTTPPT